MGNSFSYHDNAVQFQLSNSNAGSISSGSFTVTDFSISSGQDPNGDNKKGDVHQLDGSGNFHFTVGRSQTSDVADFWNNNISGDQSTFDHGAGVLNFAFLGTLVLTYTNPSNRTSTRTYQNVGLAQGQSAGANNWWFGGTNCVYKDGNTVTCYGQDSNGNKVSDWFTRGSGSGASQVLVQYNGSF